MTDGWPEPSSWSPTPSGGARYPTGPYRSPGPQYPSGPPMAPPLGGPDPFSGATPSTFGGGTPPSGSRPPSSTRGLLITTCILLALVLVGGGFMLGTILDDDQSSSTATTGAPSQLTPAVQTPSDPITGDPVEPAAAVAQALGPAIVQIESSDGLGSGVVYDGSGLILTNAHVVSAASSLSVQLPDGTRLPATLLGTDPQADIAVVKVEGSGLAVARLNQDKVVVGQVAIAIGSPFGLSQTVTEGIVSAVDRPVEGSAGLAINMIQTDAPINPGNSGGALANRKGEVIGINTQIYSQSGDNNGIGFAIPIETARTVADKIVAGESLDHGYLGVSSRPVTNGNTGAQIAEVSNGTPAANAGIQTGDVITSIDDVDVKAPADLSARIIGHSPGDEITLEVLRDGQTLTIKVTLGARPASSSSSTPPTTR